jgi:hypothetical protein
VYGYDYPSSSSRSGPGPGSSSASSSPFSAGFSSSVCAKEHAAFVMPGSYALDWYQTIGGITSTVGSSGQGKGSGGAGSSVAAALAVTSELTPATKGLHVTSTRPVHCYFWRPEPPLALTHSCVALGYVVTTEPTPPPLSTVRCVYKKYLIENKGIIPLTQVCAVPLLFLINQIDLTHLL